MPTQQKINVQVENFQSKEEINLFTQKCDYWYATVSDNTVLFKLTYQQKQELKSKIEHLTASKLHMIDSSDQTHSVLSDTEFNKLKQEIITQQQYQNQQSKQQNTLSLQKMTLATQIDFNDMATCNTVAFICLQLNIECLDLQFNQITDLQTVFSIYAFPLTKIHTLILDNNLIQIIDSSVSTQQTQQLIGRMKSLKYLSLQNNPCTLSKTYTQVVENIQSTVKYIPSRHLFEKKSNENNPNLILQYIQSQKMNGPSFKSLYECPTTLFDQKFIDQPKTQIQINQEGETKIITMNDIKKYKLDQMIVGDVFITQGMRDNYNNPGQRVVEVQYVINGKIEGKVVKRILEVQAQISIVPFTQGNIALFITNDIFMFE
ncbi:Conserved_hypothetical protein [Hexamita inflata]|uniref:Uncharacterized protein n=1 Tax=Hexamita inflata TaxID=28002 RepID=A0AA86TLS7_9EUKA|nr:Conserved hypothetical protein [Hexamita inflata]